MSSNLFFLEKKNNINHYPCGILDMISSFRQNEYNVVVLSSSNVLAAVYNKHASNFRDSGYIVRDYITNLRNFRPLSNRKYLIKANTTVQQTNVFLNRSNFRAIYIN
tara:strand:- start:18 stop:338 length:321 start_codon:yes stop_codon:yes gene_type:complete